jgi:hypothetical protein
VTALNFPFKFPQVLELEARSAGGADEGAAEFSVIDLLL